MLDRAVTYQVVSTLAEDSSCYVNFDMVYFLVSRIPPWRFCGHSSRHRRNLRSYQHLRSKSCSDLNSWVGRCYGRTSCQGREEAFKTKVHNHEETHEKRVNARQVERERVSVRSNSHGISTSLVHSIYSSEGGMQIAREINETFETQLHRSSRTSSSDPGPSRF